MTMQNRMHALYITIAQLRHRRIFSAFQNRSGAERFKTARAAVGSPFTIEFGMEVVPKLAMRYSLVMV